MNRLLRVSLGWPRATLALGLLLTALLGLGAARLELRTDGEAYRGLGGGPLKRYELLDHASLAGQRFASHLRLVHEVDGFSNDIRIEHWSPQEPLPRAVFRPDPTQGTFLERLRALLHANGLGPRIDAELAEADARVRAWEERWEP